MTSATDDDVVVFIIGIRVNAFWRLTRWLPVIVTLRRVMRDLLRQPDIGLLGYRTRIGGRHMEITQYWRSFADLHAYAHERHGEHARAWEWFHRTIGQDGTVGLWHEAYLVPANRVESIYLNMPPHGLAEAMGVQPIQGGYAAAAGRLGLSAGDNHTEDGRAQRNPSRRQSA